MPNIHVTRSIEIKQSASKIFEILSDFNQWRIWSPWLITEPEATSKVAPDGQSHSWEGKRVGEGSMTITSTQPPLRIDYDLVFLKPWKSQATVCFQIEECGEESKVSWSMDTSLPIFMFWMKKMMQAWIGMDYERGLLMLKDYVETGSVESHLEFVGETQFDGFEYIGLKNTCSMDDIDTCMTHDFEQLAQYLKAHPACEPSVGFSIYHNYDMVKRKVEYTSGFAVNKVEALSHLDEGFIKGQLPASRIYQLAHKGPYRFLGNAWSTMVGLQRAKVFKPVKSRHPFELYMNDPGTTPENELQTQVCFVCKS